jgi:hypothetical protein
LSIGPDERWVREKLYDPRLASEDMPYLHFHAEPFGKQALSCWEKHWTEQEIARTALTGQRVTDFADIILLA